METLREKQTRFAKWVPRLIDKAFELGYLVTLGEALRDPRVAKLNAGTGAGIANSLHCEKLAIDLNLYRPDGSYITDDTGHKELGAWWVQQEAGFCWGGLFKKRDWDHYSLSPDGIRE